MEIPSVVVYVRHSPDCQHKDEGEYFKGCKCRKHLRWWYQGRLFRSTAKTRSWSVAERLRSKVEAKYAGDPLASGGLPGQEPSGKTLEQAIQLFLTNKRSENLNPGVIKKYERELERLREFLAKRSKFHVREIALDDLIEFRSTWGALYPSSTTRQKVQERLRAFLRYCYDSGSLEKLPKLSTIKVDEPPTMPLSDIEYSNLLKQIPDEFQDSDKARRVHALVQLMRHSGLAIRDAVTLERSEIQKDSKKKCYRIVTNRQKTGTHVSVPIPNAVAEEILIVLNGSPRYVFWNSGNGKEESAVTNWQHDLRKVFRATFGNDTDFTPHCLRDTFAVDLLQKGVPLEEVSKLLGHESIKTTEKSYAKWVQARQDRLDSLVIATWG